MSQRNQQLDKILDNDEVIFVVVSNSSSQQKPPSPCCCSAVKTPMKPKLCNSSPVVKCKQPNTLKNKIKCKKKKRNKSRRNQDMCCPIDDDGQRKKYECFLDQMFDQFKQMDQQQQQKQRTGRSRSACHSRSRSRSRASQLRRRSQSIMAHCSRCRSSVHSNCAQSNSSVPAHMGWDYQEQRRNLQCNWRPGAIPRSVRQLMNHFLPADRCDTLPSSCCRQNAKPPCGRLVDVKRTGDDEFTVTIKSKPPELKPLQLKMVPVQTQYQRSDCKGGSNDSGLGGRSRKGGKMVGGKMVGGKMVGGKMVGGKMVGGKMVGGKMVGGRMVGGKMVGGKMVGGKMVYDNMEGGQMVGGKMIGGRMVGGRMVGGKMVGGRMVVEKMIGGKMVAGKMVGGRMVDGVLVGGRFVEEFPDRLGKASQFLGLEHRTKFAPQVCSSNPCHYHDPCQEHCPRVDICERSLPASWNCVCRDCWSAGCDDGGNCCPNGWY